MQNNMYQIRKSNFVVSGYFIYKLWLRFIYKVLGVGITDIQVVRGFEIEIKCLSKNIYGILLFLSKHTLSQFKVLIDIVCTDFLGSLGRFYIIYNLLSLMFGVRLRILSKISSTQELLSVYGIYKVADWCEREVFDFFGIFFLLNRDLRRILTDYGFLGYALRRDFPLTGFCDIYYDDGQKSIRYRSLKVIQKLKNFERTVSWKD